MTAIAIRERIRSSAPWWAKCGFKLTLVALPVGYGVLRALALARHGGMTRPQFAYDAFRRHFDDADFHRKSGGFTVLELGPGDSLAMALIARAQGAASTCHVDVGPFATGDPAVYQQMAALLAERGLTPPDVSGVRSLDDVQAACSAGDETNGLSSLRALPDASFDFIFSNGVLQSVSRDELPETMRELRRLVHPQGVCVHSIDLRDTMGQSLNHLRFPERVWDSRWFRKAGFHTNRLRFSEMMEVSRRAGFEAEASEVNRWERLPVPRKALAPPYRDRGDDDLLIATVRVVLRPAPVGVPVPGVAAPAALDESGAGR